MSALNIRERETGTCDKCDIEGQSVLSAVNVLINRPSVTELI